jgi:hypothetical protein
MQGRAGAFVVGVGLPGMAVRRALTCARQSGRRLSVGLSLQLLRLLGGVMRCFRHSLPFARELQPGLAVFLAQGAGRLVAALLGLFQIMIGFTLRHVPDRD